jgi:branched-chain amino acid transport system substrate-binding protein
VAVLAAALLLVACGSGGSQPHQPPDAALTIYTSLPRAGLSARRADVVAAGERLALTDAGGRAGGRRVRLVELDSSAPGADTWDPGTVDANARRAADDASAVAYIGELDYGASAISVPVTNGAGLLQVSPGDGLTTLTVRDPGVPAEGPARYYPRGLRTFARLVPPDYLQARALVAWARERGAKSIAILREDRLFGRELATEVQASALAARIPVLLIAESRHGQTDYADVARQLATRPADAVIYTGLGGPSTNRALTAVHAALPKAQLYGSSGLAAGGIDVRGATVLSIDSALPADRYGGAAKDVLRRLTAQRGAPTGVEALYGYEAMRLVLRALDSAGKESDERSAVSRAAMRPATQSSPIGSYSLTSSGDVTPVRFGSYRDSSGHRDFLGVRDPNGPLAPGG